MIRALPFVLSFAMLSLVGCDEDPPPPPADAMVPMARIELGTGTASYEPIPDTGGELELVGGPQGGFHVFVTARIYGIDTIEGATLTFDATDTTTGANVGTPTVIGIQETRITREGDRWVKAGDFLILHDSAPDSVRGLELDIRAHVVDAAGTTMVEDHRVITVIDLVSG